MNTTFGIALTGLLLEHEWPADITRVIQQVHDALVSNDVERTYRASHAAYAAANYAAAYAAANYAAAYTINYTAACAAAHAAAAYAADYAATAATAADYATTAADYATTAADYTARAADYAIRALPGEATRIRALHTLLTQ